MKRRQGGRKSANPRIVFCFRSRAGIPVALTNKIWANSPDSSEKAWESYSLRGCRFPPMFADAGSG